MKLQLCFLFTMGLQLESSIAFINLPISRVSGSNMVTPLSSALEQNNNEVEIENNKVLQKERRDTLGFLMNGFAAAATATIVGGAEVSLAAEGLGQPDFVQEYDDFQKTSEGWSFRDVKVGQGESPNWGDRVVFDWSGYTIGYFGRPFQAKGGPQGGAFDKEIDYDRTVLGSNKIVKGLECAMTSMKPGGIRQVLVPYGELGYPEDDPDHERVGPKPKNFSGERALDFVLRNPRVDRTLLFNVKLIRVDKPNGKGGFNRG